MEDPDNPSSVSWITPSPNGEVLAIGLCADGSENNSIRLIDVRSSRLLVDGPQQKLMDSWTGGVQWLPDSSGFFFSSISGAAVDFEQSVLLHQRSVVPKTTHTSIAWTGEREYRMVTISPNGRYAVALERLHNPIPVATLDLAHRHHGWRPFVTTVSGTVAGHIIGEHYVAVTDVGAPRGRLVAIPLDADDPNDARCWQELVPESNAVLRTITPIGSALYLTEFVETYARVRIVDFAGRARGEVPLPGRGAIVSELPFPMTNLVSMGDSGKYLFGFSSLTTSPGLYRHTPGEHRIETLLEPKVTLSDAVVEDYWATSDDGTRILYHVVQRMNINRTGPPPTLIYAYGGYNVPLLPQFPGAMAAFIAVGGVFVQAHLRGGGEFGREWWQSGRMDRKQNGYQDLYAVANALMATLRCTPQSLAVTGASNGGLMVGVAVTQRPELWAVAIPRVPILDLIGACRDAYGRMAILEELADVNDPEEVRRLAGLSPYHCVRDGVEYPAIYLSAGEADPRCPPWHARKFAARLQSATAGEAPILVRIWSNAGHGWAASKRLAVEENTEWLAFTLRHLNVDQWS